ncbi:MAG: Si-specific NAD(P)(+) transhydrogenase [Phycisphaerales bacterium]
MRHFDLVVIGSGPAGQRAAITAAKLGKTVCVVESREVVGGSAINTGTIPSKALREAILSLGTVPAPAMPTSAEFLTAARHATLKNLWTSANRVIQAEIELVQAAFARNGVAVMHGAGSFVDAHTISVQGRFQNSTVTAEHVLVAVGSGPSYPRNVPFNTADIITSDEILRLEKLPRSMIVVGGGVIGTEYASMLAAMGVKVTIIEGRARLLDFVDSEITEALQYHLRSAGVTLRMGEKVVKIGLTEAPAASLSDNGMHAEAILESGKVLKADCLLYCAGRQGCTESLNLAAAGLSADERGRIHVNDVYRTAVSHIYAAGDVVGFPALASTSMEQGRIAACSMFRQKCESLSRLVPYGIYAIPEISMVGWTEEQLTKEGIPFESGVAYYRETARGQLLGDDIGMLKLLFHPESMAVMGVHIIGTGATELVHIGQCAIAFSATLDYLINAVFNYPTLAECYKIAALNGYHKVRGG